MIIAFWMGLFTVAAGLCYDTNYRGMMWAFICLALYCVAAAFFRYLDRTRDEPNDMRHIP